MISYKKHSRLSWLIAISITFFVLFALWLRLLPMFSAGNIDTLSFVASDDPLYNLRQVEVLLSNHLNYPWFDPMTLYPAGSDIYWGPLFPIIIAIGCLLTGATTRPEIVGIGLLIPPLMGTVTIIIMYYIGRICGDWKTGLLASGFTAVVTGQFFYRSMYGYMDHHIAEVLFSTIFCLFYMYSILSEKERPIHLKDFSSYKRLLLLSALAGIAYLLGFFVMPTMILFAMIAGVFTVIQFVIDSYRGRSSEYLLILNTVVFSIAIMGLLTFGFKSAGINLSTYSPSHILADVILIGGSVFLYIVQHCLRNRSWYYYPVTIGIFAFFFTLLMYLANPQLYSLFINSLFAFFGQSSATGTVQEARGWSLDIAWVTFNYGLVLMAGGIFVMLYNNIREERPEQVFAIVWSLIILFSAWQHVRYEYYLAVNVALLSAMTVSFCVKHGWLSIHTGSSPAAMNRDSSPTGGNPDLRANKTQQKAKNPVQLPDKRPRPEFVILLFLVVILAILFAYTSVEYSYSSAVNYPTTMNPDWKESMEWMENNTPATGIDYNTVYSKNNFSYPATSYGVMSWWDYGHLITTVGKRIPNANPFQQGVAGSSGAAAYFMDMSEDSANAILDKLGSRYIVTDIEMDQGKFWAMATWFNATESTEPYYTTLLVPGNGNSVTAASFNKQPYYLTMISRLHNFDGSLTEPGMVYYIEYADSTITGLLLPVITDAIQTNTSAAREEVVQYNRNAVPGYHAGVYSASIISPLETVPALRHYRLVHESPTNVYNSAFPDVKYVKIFEYVKGAHIPGEGIIEVPLITNTGRNFTYRQASIDGEFIVPYPTTDSHYDVRTTGKYRIISTGQEYDVPESAVLQGLTIR